MTRDVEGLNARIARALAVRGLDPSGLKAPAGTILTDHLLAERRAVPQAVNEILEEVTGCPAMDPTLVSFSAPFLEHARRLLPREEALAGTAFLVSQEGAQAHVVLADPEDRDLIRRLEHLTGSAVVPHVCHSRAIREAIAAHYGDQARQRAEETAAGQAEAACRSVSRLKSALAGPQDLAGDAEVILLLARLVNEAALEGASDVHFEPARDGLVLRVRRDGVLRRVLTLPHLLREPLTDRLKLVSGLDRTQRSLPQDGAVGFGLVRDRDLDIRVSSLPGLYGEKIVLRLLDRGGRRPGLDELGLSDRDLGLVREAISRPNGLILVTGPTGSGKSTTLYSLLGELNTEGVNIVTAEDPVEYKMDGVTQVRCGSGGPSFAQAMRAFLRQDPDIIMVGEIRDAETAEFAVKAAMTGHLVLSTLHTNDAPGAVNRLTHMGLPPFLVASARITVLAQRLVRRLCPDCRKPCPENDPALKSLGALPEGTRAFAPGGCPACGRTGYRGRLGVHEALAVTEDMERIILVQGSTGELRRAALDAGMTSLRDAAVRAMAAGLTSPEEVVRVTAEA